MESLKSPEKSPEVATPLNERWMRRYLLGLLGIALGLYLLAFVLIRWPGFEAWGGSYHGPMLDYSYTVAGEDADVVIFGDSAALYDLDTVAMSKALGMKVINLPSTLGSLPVTLDMPLESYLTKNKKPRLIVFYFCAWDLDYHYHKGIYVPYEGQEMMAAHGSLGQILAIARKDPTIPLMFPFRFFEANSKAVAMAAVRHQNRSELIRAAQGHHPVEEGLPVIESPCEIPAEFLAITEDRTVLELMKKYREKGEQTLFVVSPIPDCTNAGVVQNRSYTDIPAVGPKAYPPNDFNDYPHMSKVGVPLATNDLLQTLRPMLEPR